MQGTSVCVAGGHGLGADIDWGNILQTGLDFGMNYYNAEQEAKAAKKQAKAMQAVADAAAKNAAAAGNSSGETTQDGLFKGNSGLAIGIGAVAVIGLGAFVFMGRKKRR